MPLVQPFIDPKTFQFEPLFATQEVVNQYNKQRFEMQQLDAICELRENEKLIYGYKDLTENEFWVRGHIPERPLMPGVIMIEVAAQICSFYYLYTMKTKNFFGFLGIDAVKFRGTVTVGERLVVISKNTDHRAKRAIFETQGFVGEKMVFEATIMGALIK